MRIASAARFAEVWAIAAGAAEDEAAAKEMGVKFRNHQRGIEQKIKEKMQQMEP